MRALALIALVGCAHSSSAGRPAGFPSAAIVATVPPLTVGRAATGTVTITPRGDTQLLDGYTNLKLSFAEVPGLVFDKPVLGAGDATIAHGGMVFPFVVTASQAGSFTIRGRIDYAVLCESNCPISSGQFSLEVTATAN
jgi:hypothetical protein